MFFAVCCWTLAKTCKIFFFFFLFIDTSALGEIFFRIEALLELTHFKIYTRARGREQFTVTRDFIPFTLEVLQSKYLLFLIYLKFSKAGINLQQIDLAGWAGVFACKILSGWARVFLLEYLYLYCCCWTFAKLYWQRTSNFKSQTLNFIGKKT